MIIKILLNTIIIYQAKYVIIKQNLNNDINIHMEKNVM